MVEPLESAGYTRAMSGMTKISFIGGGNMAEALIAGILKAKLVPADEIYVTDVVKGRLDTLCKTYGIKTGLQNHEAVEWGHINILCVKPQVLDEVVLGISSHVNPTQLIISVAAGYPLQKIQDRIGEKIPLVRAMPNTPAVLQEGVTALAASSQVTQEHRELSERIFQSVGKVVWTDEALMNAVTGLSGSGPAYVYLIIEALTDGGVNVGLPRTVAHTLAAQTVLGAARMVVETAEHPALLKDRVTSPGGTTIAGLQQLEEGGLRATLIDAVEAATQRARELGQ